MQTRALINKSWYGNTSAEWLSALGIFVGVVVVLYLVRRLLVGRLTLAAQRTATDIDDLAVDLIRRTRWYFILAVGAGLASLALDLPNRWENTRRVALMVIGALQAGVWGNGIVSFWINRHIRKTGRTGAAATTLGAIGFLARVLLWGVLLLVALDNVGVDVTTIVTGLGIGGIAIALAVQNILGDLLSALSIYLDKPFVVGDFIIVDTFEGTVEHIGLKTTRLRSLGGEQIIIGNSDLLRSRIRNYQRLQERRVKFVVGVQYDTPPEKCERIPGIIREVASAQRLVRVDRSHLARLSESSIDFETVYYFSSPEYNLFMDTQQVIVLELLRRFAAEGIQFAFPTRTLHVQEIRSDGADDATRSRRVVTAAAVGDA